MRRPHVWWVAALLVAGLAIIWWVPDLRYGLLRHVSKERFYEDRPTSYWIDTVNEGKDPAREHAAHVLGKIGAEDPGVVPALTAALKDRDFIVRKNAALALAEIGPAAKSATPQLIESLKDENPVVRRAVVAALGDAQADADEAIQALITALKDSDVWVRSAAIASLAGLGPKAKAAIPALLEILKQQPGRETDTTSGVITALQSIDPESARSFLVKALSSPDAATRANAIRALGDLGAAAKEVLPTLEAQLKDSDGGVRLAAAEALWKIDRRQVPAVIPILIEALKDQTSWRNRGTAADLLAKMGPEARAAIPALTEAVKDRHDDIRRLAIDALAQMGPEAKTAIPALTEALNDPEAPVRTQAAKTLERINSQQTAKTDNPDREQGRRGVK